MSDLKISDLKRMHDAASDRAYDAAAKIWRYTGYFMSDQRITRQTTEDVTSLADRLEAIVNDFGLDL